jgi:hypothetical protein
MVRTASAPLFVACMIAGLLWAGPAAADPPGAPPRFTSPPPGTAIVGIGEQWFFEVAIEGDSTQPVQTTWSFSDDGGATYTPRTICTVTPPTSCGTGDAGILADNGQLWKATAVNEFGTIETAPALLVVCDETSCLNDTWALTPGTNITSGQAVTVTALGLPPDASLPLQTCRVGGSACSASEIVTTDEDGDISATIHPDRLFPGADCLHAACEIRHRFFGAVPVSFYPAQPDLRIRRRSDGQISYDDVYNPLLLGAAVTQTRDHVVAAGGKWTYALEVQNDSPDADDIVVRGTDDPNPRFHVRYFVGYYDVTAAMQGAGVTFSDMAPGATRTIAVQFRAADDAAPKSVGDAFVAAISGLDPDGTDQLRVQVHTPPAPAP